MKSYFSVFNTDYKHNVIYAQNPEANVKHAVQVYHARNVIIWTSPAATTKLCRKIQEHMTFSEFIQMILKYAWREGLTCSKGPQQCSQDVESLNSLTNKPPRGPKNIK